jgi:beta-N-acetylhexosaminidase
MPLIGPLIVDLVGPEIDAEERDILQHPLVGGIIFFARHYESPAQIQALSQTLRRVKKTPLLITVDQEGGRVQRFQSGFTRLPSMGQVGELFDHSHELGLQLAHVTGWLMAAELISVDVDLSFAPVLDIDKNINTAIGDRAFHKQISVITALANAFMQGMHTAGMAAVGKHFPGHGSVSVDSHRALPVDTREFQTIAAEDMQPFKQLIQAGIEGIMAAHILFPHVDSKPVGFSSHWLKDILRQQLEFNGLIFSDDLSMHGANIAGDFPDRVEAALDAGCDMALICNNRPGVIKTIDNISAERYAVDPHRFASVQKRFSLSHKTLKNSPEWHQHYQLFSELSSHILLS